MTSLERLQVHTAAIGYTIGYAGRADNGSLIVGGHVGHYGELGCRYMVGVLKDDSFRPLLFTSSYHEYNAAIVDELKA